MIHVLCDRVESGPRRMADSRDVLADPHSGKYCFGKTPMQTFLDSIPLAKDKILDNTRQTAA
jgi:hypothetical protein